MLNWEDIKVVKAGPENIILDECPETEMEKGENMDQINVTLQYMMNRDLYENYILSQNETTTENTKEERKFYRSRIFQLTKVLLLSDRERQKYFEMNPEFDLSKIQFDVFLSFDAFVKNAIHNFKMIDTNDILQEDYPDETKERIECGEYVEQPFHKKTNTLDNFVISEKPEEAIMIPIQKRINLRDPLLKKKGLRKNILK